MKYIIDVPNQDYSYDEIFHTLKLKFYDDNLSCEVFLEAKPYTEPNCKAIETEVWDFARAVNDMRYDDFVSCFGGKTEEMVYELSYSEVKAAYEAWKKSKDEIHVGDEVIYNSRTRAVVLEPETEKRYGEIFTSEGFTIIVSHDDLEKTGRHFDEVEELLKKMKDEDGN